MRENNFINIIKEKERKGFTLIELLATIVIITLIFTIGFVFISDIFDSSNDAMDDITEKMILSVVEDYVLEFREEVTWNEGKDKEGNTGFCITLDSLINYGYFEGNEEEINEYRETHFIKGVVKNGVYSYTLLEKGTNGSTISNECKFYKQDTQIVNNGSGNVPINENEQKVGEFIYNVSRIDEKNYDAYVNFSINFEMNKMEFDISNYIMLIVDRSGSMNSDNKFKNAKAAAIDFSKVMIPRDNEGNIKIGLILFDTDVDLVREFKNESLTDGVFVEPDGGGTYTDEAVEKAVSVVNDHNVIKEKNYNIYTLLLFDGEMNNATRKKNLEEQTKKIKEKSKLFVIGYGSSFASDYKKIATQDSEFCKDSSYMNYCYYEADTTDISTLFSGLSTKIIENIRSTDVQNASLILEAPIINGEKAFTIMKNNRIVDKIEEDIHLNGLEESVKLVINDTYQLRISDNFFKSCSESGACEMSSLFNAKIILEYGGDIEDKVITIGQEQLPSFKITIDEINEVN